MSGANQMTLNEFKAWFDGFTEDMEGPPSDKQWKKIKARVKEITGVSTSYPVFVDRYARPYWDQPWPNRYLQAIGSGVSTSSAIGQSYSAAASGTFNPTDALYALGKADAGEIQ